MHYTSLKNIKCLNYIIIMIISVILNYLKMMDVWCFQGKDVTQNDNDNEYLNYHYNL